MRTMRLAEMVLAAAGSRPRGAGAAAASTELQMVESAIAGWREYKRMAEAAATLIDSPLATDAARALAAVRELSGRAQALTTESERAIAEATGRATREIANARAILPDAEAGNPAALAEVEAISAEIDRLTTASRALVSAWRAGVVALQNVFAKAASKVNEADRQAINEAAAALEQSRAKLEESKGQVYDFLLEYFGADAAEAWRGLVEGTASAVGSVGKVLLWGTAATVAIVGAFWIARRIV